MPSGRRPMCRADRVTVRSLTTRSRPPPPVTTGAGAPLRRTVERDHRPWQHRAASRTGDTSVAAQERYAERRRAVCPRARAVGRPGGDVAGGVPVGVCRSPPAVLPTFRGGRDTAQSGTTARPVADVHLRQLVLRGVGAHGATTHTGTAAAGAAAERHGGELWHGEGVPVRQAFVAVDDLRAAYRPQRATEVLPSSEPKEERVDQVVDVADSRAAAGAASPETSSSAVGAASARLTADRLHYALVRLDNHMLLYVVDVGIYLTLVGIFQAANFERRSTLIDYNLRLLQAAMEQLADASRPGMLRPETERER
eukprot:ctg_492.g228